MKTIYLTLALSISLLSAKSETKNVYATYHFNDSISQLILERVDSIVKEEIFYYDSINSIVASFGFNVNQFRSNSGFASSTEVSVFIKGKKKLIEMGTYFDNETHTFSGISFGFKHYLFRKNFTENSILEPYLFYNFIYRNTVLKSPLTIDNEKVINLYEGDETRYSSLEHYVGLGAELNLIQNIYINGCFGVGGYFGSIKKPYLPSENAVLYSGSNGLSAFFKVGIGIRLP